MSNDNDDLPTDDNGIPITFQGGAEDDERIVAQELPRDTRCPGCGTAPANEDVQRHILSDLGYRHDDIVFECPAEECDTNWTCGVPIGEYEAGDDLWCDSCNQTYMRVHRVLPTVSNGGIVTGTVLHLKCPRRDACGEFDTVGREADSNGVILVGHPETTGSTQGCDPEGYPDSETAGD